LRISSGYGDLRIVKELHRQFFLLLRLRDGCGLLDPFGDFPSATNNVRPTQGRAAAAACRRHGLEVEDKELLKDFVVIFGFFGCFILFVVSFNARVIFAKKKKLTIINQYQNTSVSQEKKWNAETLHK
jgi:hypothetical protein